MTDLVATIDGVTKRFSAAGPPAIDNLSASLRGGQVTGLVGPDGAGKTTLMRLLAGLLAPSAGRITALGLDTLADPAGLHAVIGYMPQRFGLYEDLTVQENLTLYADLQGLEGAARTETFASLLDFTALAPFTGRRAGRLSGGMKQKLGLACAMLRAPRLLLLDEPSVGVDPLSRRELWQIVHRLADQGIAVLWSTSYLDEAENCAEVMVLSQGHLLYQGPPHDLTARVEGRVFQIRGSGAARRRLLAEALRRPEILDGVLQGEAVRLVTATPTPDLTGLLPAEASLTAVPPRFEDAFVTLLGDHHHGAEIPSPALPAVSAAPPDDTAPVVEAIGLTKRFGDFVAADNISLAIRRGEIFGLLGPNGAGKSTTFKMMCGLLRPTAGSAHVDGLDLYHAPAAARARLGYMAQKFSLYGDLSVAQNLTFFAGAYGLAGKRRRQAIDRAVTLFDLAPHLRSDAGTLPLGFKQRLALACATLHEPPVLFLDEPTSGVDPLTRREFWLLINGVVAQGVTVMVTTHFMDEAEYCDRVAIVYRGRTIAIGTPETLQDDVRSPERPRPTLEDAFIALIEQTDREG